MTSECTACAIIGFIVLPLLIVASIPMPLYLVWNEKHASVRVKLQWCAAIALSLFLAYLSGSDHGRLQKAAGVNRLLGQNGIFAFFALAWFLSLTFRFRQWRKHRKEASLHQAP